MAFFCCSSKVATNFATSSCSFLGSVFNNPINNTDPSGFSATDSGIGIMAWGAGVTALVAGDVGDLGAVALNPVTSAFMPSIGGWECRLDAQRGSADGGGEGRAWWTRCRGWRNRE